jgi:hypothetical protein
MACGAILGHTENAMISAIVTLTQAQGTHRQFVATSGTGHHLLLDDAAGNTGAKPIELVAIALTGCTAFGQASEAVSYVRVGCRRRSIRPSDLKNTIRANRRETITARECDQKDALDWPGGTPSSDNRA